METRKTPNCQSNLEKINIAGGIMLFDFKLYYKDIIFKTVWFWYKNRYMDQWNGIENPERNPHIYGQLTQEKGAKNLQHGKRQSLR